MGDYSRVSTNSKEHCNGTVAGNDPYPAEIDTAAPDDSSVKTHEGSRRNRCLCRCLFPDAPASEYKKTLKELCRLSWPLMLYLAASMLFSMTSIIFTGHLGKEQIVAASLGQSVIHVFWRAPMIGFASGADTLFTQTFGSTNKKRVGIMLQRFLVMSMLLAVCCWGILLNTEGLLLLFGQDPRIAKLSGAYGMIFIAATPADVVVVQLMKYLESQSIVRPLLIITIIMGVLNVLLHFITVSALQFGLPGAVGAQVITYYLGAFMISGYIYKRRLYKLTWPGLYGITEVGAHAVLFNISSLTWCLANGVGIGGSILIGNSLGAKQPTTARITSCLTIIVTAILSMIFVAFYLPLKDVLGYIFTKDTDVVQLAASIVPIIAISEVFDSVNGAFFCILRGCGYQYVGAVVVLLGQSTGLVLGVALMFTYDKGLKGLWLGMMAALFIENVMCMVFISCFINWDKEVIKAQKRAAVLPTTSEVDCKNDAEMPLESMGDNVDEEAVKLPTTRDEDERTSIRDEEVQVCQNDCHSDGESNSRRHSEGEQSGFCQQEPENTQDAVEEAECGEEETRPNCSSDDEKQDEARPAEEEEPEIGVLTLDRLSFAQLILRRGLALFLCISFLLASVYVAVYVVPAVRPTFSESMNATANSTSEYITESLNNGTYIVGGLGTGALTVDLTEF
ncbi:multidrug and toxin extrusion protein 1-like isoform X2 [Patiria miniata]|uniref:Multidrug and toxin extrusion protein n=1 Tax=Patiria miniata TaxID=46514 RepID=A0A913ZD49_PATMI|nr:multidrug and toxin extrusion protein 1-like isoform X2 [Patiria miniata]